MSSKVRDHGFAVFGIGNLEKSCVTGDELLAACMTTYSLSEAEYV